MRIRRSQPSRRLEAEVERARALLGELGGTPGDGLVELAAAAARRQHELQAALARALAGRARAERDSRIKSSFLRIMTHELKTPLTAMQLQMELAERDPDFTALPRLRDAHARLRRASRRLLHLIDTMLEWARVESGRTRLFPECFDLTQLLDEVLRDLSAQAQQKRLAFDVAVARELQPDIVSDRRLVGLVLLALVGRALQLTPAGKVELRVDQDGAERRIAIRDGAPHRALDELEPLEAGRPSGASGMPLYVARDIARAVGAELRAEYKPGEGHLLTLTLPSLDAAGSAQPGAAANGSVEPRHPHA